MPKPPTSATTAAPAPATAPATAPAAKALPIVSATEAAEAIIYLAAPAGERRSLLHTDATAADVKAATDAAREAIILATAALIAGLPCPVAGVTFRAANGDTCNGASALRRASGIDPKAFGRIVGRV